MTGKKGRKDRDKKKVRKAKSNCRRTVKTSREE